MPFLNLGFEKAPAWTTSQTLHFRLLCSVLCKDRVVSADRHDELLMEICLRHKRPPETKSKLYHRYGVHTRTRMTTVYEATDGGK